MLRWLFRLPGFAIRLITIVGLTGIGLSAVAIYLSPEQNVVLAFLGLSFLFWLGLAAVGLIYAVIRKKRMLAAFTAICILLSHDLCLRTVGFGSSGAEVEGGEKALRVMSFNVRLFDLYNWTSGAETRDEIFNFLVKRPIDVWCFQEFYHTRNQAEIDPRAALIDQLGAAFYHDAYTHEIHDTQFFGLLTLTRYPIVGRGEIAFASDPNNYCIYTDVVNGIDTLRIFNTHLASIRFQREDYRAIDRGPDQEETKRLLLRLASGYKRRASQIETVMQHVQKSPFPVVLCGDFNDTPVSYSYQQAVTHLHDSFRGRHPGFGGTHIGLFQFLRIDFILHSKNLNTAYFKLHDDVELSDHHPLETHLIW